MDHLNIGGVGRIQDDSVVTFVVVDRLDSRGVVNDVVHHGVLAVHHIGVVSRTTLQQIGACTANEVVVAIAAHELV